MSEASVIFRKFEVEAGGRKWTLPRPTLGVEAAFARYLETKAVDVINRNRFVLGPAASKEALQIWIDRGVENYYGWMREGFCRAVESAENLSVLIMHWVNSNHPTDADPLHIKMTGADAYKLYAENKAVWDTVMNDVLSDQNPLLPE